MWRGDYCRCISKRDRGDYNHGPAIKGWMEKALWVHWVMHIVHYMGLTITSYVPDRLQVLMLTVVTLRFYDSYMVRIGQKLSSVYITCHILLGYYLDLMITSHASFRLRNFPIHMKTNSFLYRYRR